MYSDLFWAIQSSTSVEPPFYSAHVVKLPLVDYELTLNKPLHYVQVSVFSRSVIAMNELKERKESEGGGEGGEGK